RDLYVTGVQTCALPIWSVAAWPLLWLISHLLRGAVSRHLRQMRAPTLVPGAAAGRGPGAAELPGPRGAAPGATGPGAPGGGVRRSEERRVGKECRDGWA